MKTNKISIAAVLAFLSILIFASLFSTAQAITGNYTHDRGEHPYVCLVALYNENGE